MRQIKEIITKIEETLTQKGNTYGTTYRKVATMLSVQPQYSIMVRMLEKIARIHNMLRTGTGTAEHLQEEFIDISCYAILAAFECPTEDKSDV